MRHIVITGSTRGIGFGLAKQFLKAGCKVTINGTSQENVQHAMDQLAKSFSREKINGCAGNVAKKEDLEKLWDHSVAKLGKVDIWINNAGIDQHRKLIWELDQMEYEKVIQTNVIGVMNGSIVAFNNMKKQGHGQIFNMEGFGSNGMMRERMSVYGTSKSAVRYFTRSLSLEAKDTPVQVGTLSPGMVATDFLKQSLNESESGNKQTKKVLNILADDVDTVTRFLVEEILTTHKNGAQIEWLTKPKIFWRFMSSRFKKPKELFK